MEKDSRTRAGSIQNKPEHLVVTETKEGVYDNDGVLCPEANKRAPNGQSWNNLSNKIK